MADLNQDDLVRAFTAAAIAANDHARAQDVASKSTNDYAAAQEQASKDVEAASKKTKDALQTLALSIGSSAVDYGRAMATGGEGLGKYSGAVQGAADAAGNAATTMLASFGPLGIIVGGVIKAFGMLVGASLKQNDQLMKSYRELSDVGSVSGSLEKLQSDFNKVGLTTEDAAKFGSMLKKVAPDLANFGGSVSAGKDKLIGVVQGLIGPNNQIEIAMGRIGYGAEEMRDATSDYIAKQSKLGLAQTKTTDQLRDESVKYMVTLRELGELTGMSRDEAQKLMDQQQADARFSMDLRRMEMEGKGDEARRLQAYMATYEKTFGKEAAAGLMEQVVNKGAIVGEASVKAHMSTQGKAFEMAEKVAKGQVTMQEGLSDTAAGVRRNMDQLGPSFMVAGKGLATMTGEYEQINAAYSIQNKKNIDVAGNLVDTQKKGGDLLNKNLTLEQQTRQARIIADKTLTDVAGATITVFQKLNDVVFGLGKSMAKFIDGLTGTGMFGMTATNWSESFRDLGDNAADMKTAAAEKASLVAEIETSKKEIAAMTANSSDKEKSIADIRAQMRQKEQQISDMQREQGKIKDITLAKEHAAEIAKAKRSLMDLNQQLSAGGSKADTTAIVAEKQKMLLEKQQKLAIEEEKLQKLAKEKLKLGFTTGGAAGEAATGKTAGGGEAAAPASPEKQAARAQAAAALPAAGAGRTEEILNKLNLKGGQGGQATAGGNADPALLAIAEKIQEAFPGSTFTSLNDAFHKKERPGSKHTTGKALDFTLPVGKIPKNAEEAATIKESLRDLGGSKVLDEYYADKNENTKGGHFHVEVAKQGGAFSGPNAGYPVMLHGKQDDPESVWPEKKLKGLLDEVQKSSIEDYKREVLADMGLNKTSSPDAAPASQSNSDGIERMMEMMTQKFDDMIAHLDTSNSTLSNLLTYAKA